METPRLNYLLTELKQLLRPVAMTRETYAEFILRHVVIIPDIVACCDIFRDVGRSTVVGRVQGGGELRREYKSTCLPG